MADHLEAKISAILLDCPLASGIGDQDIADMSKRFAEIGSAGRALNRPLATQKSIEACLGKLRGSARNLISQFDQMPPEALAAMELDGYGRLRLVETLLEIVWRAEDGAKIAPRLKTNQRRPPNVQAICATLHAQRAWGTLTGKKPTTGFKDRANGQRSDFEQFLSRIFAELGIRANSEHYARELHRGADWREIVEERLRRCSLGPGS